jgi:hypothetical protein
MEEIKELSRLIKDRNEIDHKISQIVRRPAEKAISPNGLFLKFSRYNLTRKAVKDGMMDLL